MKEGDTETGDEQALGVGVMMRVGVVGIVVSGLFLAFFLKDFQWASVGETLQKLSPWELGAVALVLVLEFPLRALRWSLLMSPICRDAGPEARFSYSALLSATFIGFASNNLLPARAGELVRPYLASRLLRVRLGATVMTSVIERGFDVLGLAALSALFFYLLGQTPSTALSSGVLTHLSEWGGALGVLAGLGLICLVILAFNGRWVSAWLLPLFERLPSAMGHFGTRILTGLLGGLVGLREGPRVAGVLALTLMIWLNGAVAIWLLMGVFGIELPFVSALFLTLAIALAVVVPQAPGFIGIFQVATEMTLVAWGVGEAVAESFALAFWVVSFLPVTLGGLIALWLQGMSLRGLARGSAEAGRNLTPPGEAA